MPVKHPSKSRYIKTSLVGLFGVLSQKIKHESIDILYRVRVVLKIIPTKMNVNSYGIFDYSLNIPIPKSGTNFL